MARGKSFPSGAPPAGQGHPPAPPANGSDEPSTDVAKEASASALTVGRIVLYVMPNGDDHKGEVRPAIVVRPLPGDRANLRVMLDGPNDRDSVRQINDGWVGTVEHEPEKSFGTWHWPDRG